MSDEPIDGGEGDGKGPTVIAEGKGPTLGPGTPGTPGTEEPDGKGPTVVSPDTEDS